MRPGFTPSKTIMEDTLELLQYGNEATLAVSWERGISRSSLESRDYDVKNTWRCRDNGFAIMVPLRTGMGQNCLKTPPLSRYQGEMA
jgi:hypothetical protein